MIYRRSSSVIFAGSGLSSKKQASKSSCRAGSIFAHPAIQFNLYIVDFQLNGKNQKTGKPISHGTLIKHWLNLHSFFETAVEDGFIETSPMQRMRYPKPRKDEAGKGITVYDAEQVKYILQCAEQEPLKWRAFIMLALDTGCRKGEIVGLKWSDIDFKTGRVTISRNVQYTNGSTGIYVTTPKTGKARTITINPPALRVLAEWKREQLKAHSKQCIPIAGWVFTQDSGEVMHPSAPVSYMIRFGKRYNLPGIHCHALRHTMASLAITNGADAVSVSEKLGHAKPSITLDVYSHANEESQKRANAILASVIYEQKQA